MDLTMWETVLQSQSLHPDWDAQEHIAYLDMECHPVSVLGRRTGETPEQVVERWLRENADAGRPEAELRKAGIK